MIRHALVFWVSIALALLGLVLGLMSNIFETLKVFIFPLVLLGLIYYAYKSSPAGKTYRSGHQQSKVKVKPSQKTMSKVAGVRKSQAVPGKRKSYPFQVIEGSKGKNDDHLPKYH